MECASHAHPWTFCPWPPAVAVVQRFTAARAKDLGHLAWYLPAVEHQREKEFKHLHATVYLDYAGAALYSQEQVRAAGAAMLENFLANPHTSKVTEDVVAQTRRMILGMFGVTESSHTLVFTSGATQALQLVGECFAWGPKGVFLYAGESHTSLLGLRQFARRAGAACGHFDLQELPKLCSGLEVAVPLGVEEDAWLEGGRPAGPMLLAVPGESNLSGVRADLGCIAQLRSGSLQWRVLLDAAKLACSPGSLDLAACPADFAVVSFYKMFGLPTGLGALLVRHDAAPLLAPGGSLGTRGPTNAFGPAYFAGGSVSSISATSDFAVPRPSLTDWLERGTSHFQGVAVLPSQLRTLRALASDTQRRRHAEAVCREAYLRMRDLRHANGQQLCRLLGRHGDANWWEVQGPTLAFLLFYHDASPVPYGLVQTRAASQGFLLRAGCHCNAGGCQSHLGLSDADVRHFFASGKVCGDDMGLVDGRPTGVIRLSFGLYSTLADVSRWLEFLELEFLDRQTEELPMSATCQVPQLRPEAAKTSQQRDTGLELPAAPQDMLPVPVSVAPEASSSTTTREKDTAETGGRSEGRGQGKVVALKVYPIKGCGPLSVRHWPLDPSTGALFLDRRWCLAPEGRSRLRPVSAKQAPKLTQVQLTLELAAAQPALLLSVPGCTETLSLPLSKSDADVLRRSGAEAELPERLATATTPTAPRASDATSWFQALLGTPGLQLVEAGAAPGTGEAPAGAHFANAPSTLLLVSGASLQAFGRLCGLSVPARRFRANLEVDFQVAFEEDSWPMGLPLLVGPARFEAAGRCVRCQAVDVDPDDPSASGPSLLAALATAQIGGSSSKGPTFGSSGCRHRWSKPAMAPSDAFLAPNSTDADAFSGHRWGFDLGLEKSPTEAMSSSFFMILATELGDETFIIAAVMAMRHPKLTVLGGALSALYFMTVLSAVLGVVLPNLISQQTVHKCATILYTFFGLRLMWVGSRGGEEDKEEEFEEVENALKETASKEQKSFARRMFSKLCTPIFLEALMLTFLAEWGDRSQIATITLAAHQNPAGVIVGACVGHTICTSLAVFGGEWLGKRISQRLVAFIGGFLFLIFALLNAYNGSGVEVQPTPAAAAPLPEMAQ